MLPAPIGDDSPGGILVKIYNDGSLEARVRVAGPTAQQHTETRTYEPGFEYSECSFVSQDF